MDQLPGEDGPRTPLERIKEMHQQKREQILYGDGDELEWDQHVHPHQVGLTQVWIDEEGKAWIFVRKDDKTILKRVWTHL